MKEPEIISKLVDAKAAKDNTIDLNAYTLGIIDAVNALRDHDCEEFIIRDNKFICTYCGESFQKIKS